MRLYLSRKGLKQAFKKYLVIDLKSEVISPTFKFSLKI